MDTPAKKLANLANLKRLSIFAPSMALYLITEFFRDLLKLLSPAYAEKLFIIGSATRPFFSEKAYLHYNRNQKFYPIINDSLRNLYGCAGSDQCTDITRHAVNSTAELSR